ncbi:hypothetical protein QYF36_015281 [Acer negundo]|nr:hypothetical protein QYF36_015281 [Acer negundo]
MSITIGGIVVAFLSFLIIFWWRSWNRNHSPIRNWPVVGMLPGVFHNIRRIHEYAANTLKESGYTLVFKGPWFANIDYVITSDPANVHHILSRNFSNYGKGPKFRMIMETLGDGLVNAEGDSWKIQRKIIHSAVHHSKFKSALEKIIRRKVERGLIPVLENVSKLGIAVDMQEVFQRFTFDSTCLMLLGFDPNCLSVEFPQVEFGKAYDDMDEVALYRHLVPESIWKLQRWLQIGQEKKLRIAWETFDKFLYGCISLKREKLSRRSKTKEEGEEEEEEEEFDLLTAFMLDEDEEKDTKKVDQQMNAVRKSDKFLRDTTFNLLVAGRDTVSAGLTWFFWLIATHPSVENKILEEIRANIQTGKDGDQERLFSTAQELNRLVYLHAALCETLRLYPSVPFNHKATTLPDVLPTGHHVNQDTKILISFYSMGRLEEIWGKDCLEFKPERWISEQGQVVHRPSYQFAAFGAGPRICIGKDIALVQMKMVATAMLWNYRMQLVDDHPISPRNAIILHMEHGLKLHVFKRNV